jgi:Methyltransferase domain
MVPTFWRDLIDSESLTCPRCTGALCEAIDNIYCAQCSARYPVEVGVPMFIRPDDIVDVTSEVITAFGLPENRRAEVGDSLASLAKHRINFSSSEFSNFFARFQHRFNAVPAKLSTDEVSTVLNDIDCIATYFTAGMKAGEAQYRTLRLKNRSTKCLYSSDSFPLYLSYKLYDSNGIPTGGEAPRTELPAVLRPDEELSVPILVDIPASASGHITIKFCFVLEGARWFVDQPLATVNILIADELPAGPPRFNELREFDLEEDLMRSTEFITHFVGEIQPPQARRKRILEIGGGVHPICLRAHLGECEIIVSDLSLVQQQICSIAYEKHPANKDGRIGFASIDAMHLPFSPGEIDVIVICAALHHFPSPDGLLRHLSHMLSEQGCIIAVREPCYVNPYDPTYRLELYNGFDEQMFELTEWNEIAQRANLRVIGNRIDYGCSLKMCLVRI